MICIWRLILIPEFFLVAILATSVVRTALQDESLQRAKDLWELAITAKGGRQKLNEVKNFVEIGASEPVDLDFMVYPGKFFRWADTGGSKIGLIVEMFNFERNNGYTIFGADPPKIHANQTLNPELRSRFLTSQLYYLLESRWLKPEILGTSKAKINGKNVDEIEILIKGFGTPFRYGVFLDEITHLPVRIGMYSSRGMGVYSKRRKGNIVSIIDLREYREIEGVKVPTEISADGGKWSRVQIEINIDYNPQVFEQTPDVKSGPFQWRKGRSHPPRPNDTVSEKQLTTEQIGEYLRDLESWSEEKIKIAKRELISAGEQAAPALIKALQSGNRRLRFPAAETLLEIYPAQPEAIYTLRDILLDNLEEPDRRQDAAFQLMRTDDGIILLRGLLKHQETIVRRCVIFAFDELTERTEIPPLVKNAVPILRELLQDKDEVVRGMAHEILEQISHNSNR